MPLRKFSLFCALLALCFSIFQNAVAAPRAGAPRPLHSANAPISGTRAQFINETLIFAREENGGREWLAAVPRRDGNATWKILDWIVGTPDFEPPEDSPAALSPDQSRLAYVSNRSGMEAIYLESVGEKADDGFIKRITMMARNPVWLDDETLLYESTRPGRKGVYRVALPAQGSTPFAPQQLFARGGEFALSRDGKLICVAATNEKTGASQLTLLSSDGSGARTLMQTEGARRPAFAPDGKAIFYDAPAPLEDGKGSTPFAGPERERVLWMLPLTATPPVAQLFAVREGKNGDVEIIGTLFSHEDGVLQARLDFSPGEADPENFEEDGEETAPEKTERVWFACPLRRAPIQNGVLGSWPLPRKRGGETQLWTMRLTAVDGAGERTQSTLSFTWPLEKESYGVGEPATPAFVTKPKDFELPANAGNAAPAQTPAIVPFPVKPAPVIAPVAKPRPTPTPLALPAPALPPAPKNPAPKSVKPTPAPPLARRVEIVGKPVAVKPKPVAVKPKPSQKPNAKPKQSGGIPSRMKSGASVPVTVALKNTGSRSWSSTGQSPVRLIYRWVSADSNIRYRWAVHWLGEVVSPQKSTKMKFNLVAPPTTGRYILTYALVRLNSQIYDGKSYKPPASNARDHRWPGEFGAVAFEISVTP